MNTCLPLVLTALLSLTLGVRESGAAIVDLFVSSLTTNSVVRVTPNGSTSTVATGLSSPLGLAFGRDGFLYESDGASGKIMRIGLDGSKTVYASGLNIPRGLAFDAAGNLYVGTSGTVSKVLPDGTFTAYATGFGNVYGVTFDSAGRLFVSDFATKKIIQIVSQGLKLDYATLPNAAYFLAFNQTGSLFVSEGGVGGDIIEIAPGGLSQSVFTNGGGSQFAPNGLAFDDDGNLLVANLTYNNILKFGPDGGQSILANVAAPAGIAFYAAPEPAAAGLVMAGAVALFSRRRRAPFAG